MKAQRLFLLICDIIGFAVSFSLALFIRQSSFYLQHFGEISFNLSLYLITFLISLAVLIFCFSVFNLYRIRAIEFSARIFTTLKALLLWVSLTAGIMYAIKYDFSRTVFLITVFFSVTSICLFRYLLFINRRNASRIKEFDVHIIGNGDESSRLEKQILAVFTKSKINKIDLRKGSSLDTLKHARACEIFIADERLSREEVLSIIVNPGLRHHHFRVISNTFKLITGDIDYADIDEIPSISFGSVYNPLYLIIKRLLDIFTSSVGIIITSPLWILIMLAIKFDSKGPIFIKQTRVGLNFTPFTMYKFRTMQHNTLLYELAPRSENDRRVTTAGRFLRRLSLDELPQLMNIFKGDMSLVGPRPEMEFMVKDYLPWQKTRLMVKPGLTGLWQILGRKNIPLHENLEYDFYYVSNQSLILDAVILLKTVPAVLFGRGAY